MAQNLVSPIPLSEPRVELRPLLKNVYMWMMLGLLLTTAVALVTSAVEPLRNLALNPIVLIVAVVAQLGLVLGLSFGLRRFSAQTATIMFLLYAGTMGFTLSLVLLAFSATSIAAALGTTAVLFGTMTVIGLTTQMDLSKVGTYLFIGLIGLLIAMVVNIFLRSSGLEFIISIAGVLIFTGLAAYDTQKIKQMAMDPAIEAEGPELMHKLSIMGALTLYLDLVNLFLFLLRLFGSRD
ncbi:MAG: Bax inhibitor-1/YccA family protein [Aggregatilineales bacterium]